MSAINRLQIGLAILLLCSSQSMAQNLETIKQIRDTILTSYDEAEFPSQTELNEDGTLNVVVTFTIMRLLLDEHQSKVTMKASTEMLWTDNRLQWDPNVFNNTYEVPIDPNLIWKPSMIDDDGESSKYNSYEFATLTFDGDISYNRIDVLASDCTLDYSKWPWDIHECSINIRDNTKDRRVKFSIGINETFFETDMLRKASDLHHWTLTKALILDNFYRRSKTPLSGNTPDLTLTVEMKRVSMLDRKLAVMPNLVVSCLVLSIFWIFPTSRLRLHVCYVNLIIVMIFMITLRNQIPSGSAQLPIIGYFSTTLATMIVVQIILTFGFINLVNRKDRPPLMLIDPLFDLPGKLLLLNDLPLIGKIPHPRSLIAIVQDNQTRQNEQSDKRNSQISQGSVTSSVPLMNTDLSTEWSLLAQAIDRVLFVIYLLIIIVQIGFYSGSAAA